MQIERAELVRRLLGTASQLFLDDCDPISVHCLASSALEHAEYLATKSTDRPFRSHVFGTFPEMSEKDFKRLRNCHWNVIKHSQDFKGNAYKVRARLADFDDSSNDATLFVGWYDYMNCGLSIPIAAQVLQLWFFRVYPNTLNLEKDFDLPAFDEIDKKDRKAQKAILVSEVNRANKNPDIADHPMSDGRPLVLK